MNRSVKIGIIGDFESRSSQLKTNKAIKDCEKWFDIAVDSTWLSTGSLSNNDSVLDLSIFDGIWGGPGNYSRQKGAIRAIHYCRMNKTPFLGT